MENNPGPADIRELLSPDPPHRHEVHYTRLGRLLLISAIIFLLLFAGTSAAILWRIQNQAEERAVTTVQGQVEIARQWLTDRLEALETLDPQWLTATANDPRALPQQWIGADKAWHALRVIAVTGETLTHIGPTQDLPTRLAPPATRDTLATQPSLPLKGRNTWVVPMFYPATAEGVQTVGFFNLSAFEQLFRQLHPDGTGSLSLFSSDGVLLLRHPFPEQLIGKDFSQGPLFSNRLAESDSGSNWAPQNTDGILRLVAYRKLENYPLVLTVGLEAEAILNRARNEILTAAAILLTVFLFTGVVVGLLIRQYRLAESSRRWLLDAEARLRDLATHDSLTECLNRRAILVEASNELHRYRRTRRPFSLLMIDIDNFKQLNDRYGHLVGDSILVGMATLCRDLLRPSDQIGRYGGEEFLVLLPETDAQTAAGVADRLRSAVAGLPFETGKEQVTITLSVGVAVATPDMQSLKPLIQSADAALYAAKEKGRDRVCLSVEAEPQVG